MPLYFFDLVGECLDEDKQGSDLPGDQSARAYALRLASIMASENPKCLCLGRPLGIHIRTEDTPVMSVTISVDRRLAY